MSSTSELAEVVWRVYGAELDDCAVFQAELDDVIVPFRRDTLEWYDGDPEYTPLVTLSVCVRPVPGTSLLIGFERFHGQQFVAYKAAG